MNTHLNVSDLMTPKPITVTPKTLVCDARLRMEEAEIRHLPVVEGGHVVGMLSQRDVLRAQSLRLDLNIQVHVVMSKRLRSVSPGWPASKAADLMLRHKIGALPVLDGDTLVGMLTETDFVRVAHQVLDLWMIERCRA